MDDMTIFVPITKIDAAQRLVYGVVTAEKPDVSGEVCDYASTKPFYQKWSQNFASATDGKSLGNLRAMHSHVAAGKLVEIAFNDEQKRIEICGKVVDDAEWQKVEEGVYTGFSQGGRYLKRWPDPDEPALMRYTAEPLEVSLVDHPCLPEATFAVIKVDGSTELRKFKIGMTTEANALTEALAKIGARHSKADKERIKQTHDLLVDLDPECCAAGIIAGAKVDPQPSLPNGKGTDELADAGQTEKLAKLLDASLEKSLTKALRGVTARIDDVSARLKKIEDQPQPLGTTSVRIAEKCDDALFPKPDQLLDQPGALEALAEAAIRKAQSNPMRAIPGFRARKE
jgi:Putative phage serine protease XkdF